MQRKPQLQPYRVDLRVGVVPPDAAALGETEWSKAHRVGQTSLCLKPHGGLRLPLPETTVPSAGVADFTITLDVMIDRTDWPAGAVGTLVDGLFSFGSAADSSVDRLHRNVVRLLKRVVQTARSPRERG